MRFLIAGLGSIGRRHLRNLLALGERDIVLYRTFQSTMPADELVDFPVETDLQAALSWRPDAVIVANPTACHLDVAIPAAQAGCHLLLEKPISDQMKRVEQLNAAVKQSGSRVLVGFQFRCHPVLQQIHGWFCSSRTTARDGSPTKNPIGRPISARAIYAEYLPGWHPWEDYRQGYSARADLGGGVILTLCHPLDYLNWLFGKVNGVWAFTGRLSDLDLSVEDTAQIGLRFDSGALATIHLDYIRQPPAHQLEVIGTEGTLVWDNADGAASLFLAKEREWKRLAPPSGFERNDLFLAEMRHFLSVIRGESEPLCTLADGLYSLKIALAAHQSNQQGKVILLNSKKIDHLKSDDFG